LGARRIQHELERLHDIHLSLETIHKVLKQYDVAPLKRKKKYSAKNTYQKDIPGERVQLDTMKIRPGVFQYTAIDDCSRFLVAELYPKRTAANTLRFLELILDAFVVSIQVIQTDRGAEFMAMKVQQFLRDNCIKFRPNRPGAPHLNGKVERVQRTMRDELYSSLPKSLDFAELNDELGQWVQYYNYQRIHGSLIESPIGKFTRLMGDAPFWEEVGRSYDPTKERFYERVWKVDQAVSAR
jgi:transposase InsO family protein